MDRAHPELPSLVYRGLDRCDLCGGSLAPSETLAGICHACRWPDHGAKRDDRRKASLWRGGGGGCSPTNWTWTPAGGSWTGPSRGTGGQCGGCRAPITLCIGDGRTPPATGPW